MSNLAYSIPWSQPATMDKRPTVAKERSVAPSALTARSMTPPTTREVSGPWSVVIIQTGIGRSARKLPVFHAIGGWNGMHKIGA